MATKVKFAYTVICYTSIKLKSLEFHNVYMKISILQLLAFSLKFILILLYQILGSLKPLLPNQDPDMVSMHQPLPSTFQMMKKTTEKKSTHPQKTKETDMLKPIWNPLIQLLKLKKNQPPPQKNQVSLHPIFSILSNHYIKIQKTSTLALKVMA